MSYPSRRIDLAARLAAVHLRLRHGAVHRALEEAVAERKRMTATLRRPEIKPVCVSDEQVDQLLAQSRTCCDARGGLFETSIALTESESACEHTLADNAARRGVRLPLRALAEELELSDDDLNALLLCATAELHPAYGRIFAFIQDDMRRQLPTLALVADLTTRTAADRFERRANLGPFGTLRRTGLLCAVDHAGPELQTPLRAAQDLVTRFTAVDTCWSGRYFDADEVFLDARIVPGRFGESDELRGIASAIEAGRINTVGVWGATGTPLDDAVTAIAVAAHRPLRRWEPGQNLRHTFAVCDETGGILHIGTDALFDTGDRNHSGLLEAGLRNDRVAVIFSGEYPWRPTSILKRRHYVEMTLTVPSESRRKQQWRRLVPGIQEGAAADLAQRFRLTPSEQLATVQTAKAALATRRGDEPGSLPEQLMTASRTVSQQRASRFANAAIPERTSDDLVLSESLHAQVMEIPRFFRALGTVNEKWGFRRRTGGGIKALFTGDSGTGKTLAAEVIANEIGLPLMTLDVSQLVSKWLGETEQNIEAAFREAEASHSMLFFDEADTLFGKRGEIQSGTDRYANLEVGFLLQRLERFTGLAILASNLKDEIDDAFIRRFHVLLHFPRPGRDERLRLWRIAFPPQAPLDAGVDVEALLELDLTGAGIMAVAQTAALLAADQGAERIRAEHIAAGVSRQYHRESRVLGPGELWNLQTGMGARRSNGSGALHGTMQA